MAEATSATPTSELAGRHARSIAQMHSTAKWVLSAAAGLAALLIAGLRLVDVRNIMSPPIDADDWPALVAVLSVGAAVAGTVRVINRARRLFTVTYAGFDQLIDEMVAADRRAVADRGSPGPDTPPAWKTDPQLQGVVEATRTHLLPAANDPEDAYNLRDELAEALRARRLEVASRSLSFTSRTELREDLDRLDASIAAALLAADEVRVKEAFDNLMTTLNRAIAGITAAVIVFVAVTALAPTRPPEVTQPTPVVVYERPHPGQRCQVLVRNGVAIDGTFEEPVVVVGEQAGCSAQQFTVTKEVGVAVPVTAPKSP